MSRENEVQHGLLRLQQALQQAQLWQQTPVSAEALASTQPFAIDTLSFPQWLQFIYLPKLQALLDAGQPLPTKVAVAPMAEQTFAGSQPALVAAIAHLDALLCSA
ncbi:MULTISPECIES: YqcC family protein [Ferrimonas]|uniref:YqcC family protein n=1 Tax=Ferrimonas TaxID=44011 RepID=UPI0004264BC3|nr:MULTISPECIES: YqcC family protein [Ferrimonas]USD36784.1 YqcC family protein [Ferrimonas sp. SCSIO 43195]